MSAYRMQTGVGNVRATMNGKKRLLREQRYRHSHSAISTFARWFSCEMISADESAAFALSIFTPGIMLHMNLILFHLSYDSMIFFHLFKNDFHQHSIEFIKIFEESNFDSSNLILDIYEFNKYLS